MNLEAWKDEPLCADIKAFSDRINAAELERLRVKVAIIRDEERDSAYEEARRNHLGLMKAFEKAPPHVLARAIERSKRKGKKTA